VNDNQYNVGWFAFNQVKVPAGRCTRLLPAFRRLVASNTVPSLGLIRYSIRTGDPLAALPCLAVLRLILSLPKALYGANGFESNDIQEQETETSRSGYGNVNAC